jgi:hypothetical protein
MMLTTGRTQTNAVASRESRVPLIRPVLIPFAADFARA